jgi:hypothetical protein
VSGTFAARYPGTCAACSERIAVDDDVRYVDDELLHDDCATDGPPPPPRRVERPLCPACYLVHVGECP